MPRPSLVISAPAQLFRSFFTPAHQRRLDRTFFWQRNGAGTLTSELRTQLATANALITTWDSPQFSDQLLTVAPKLRIIAHCGGEVKSRFAADLFERLSITTAPEPMARATAELGAALVLYCGRNLDFYRQPLQRPRNRIYRQVHCHGTPETVIGGQVGMIGFGRVGRTLVDLLRGFNLRWQVYDPYARRSLDKIYPVEFISLSSVLRRSRLLVLTAALTEETAGILNRQNLARLPDGATVINVARGGLVNLEALTREVASQRLRCAVDVTDPLEPLPERHRLRRLPGAIVTPHIGGGSVTARHEMAEHLISELERFFRGEPIRARVTLPMLARMT